MKSALYSFVLALSVLLGTAWGAAVDSADVKAFFRKYVELGDAYDVRIADMYLDTAVIRAYRRYPHGLERTMELTGAQWKTMVTNLMPLAKIRGDRSTYTNIKISVEGARAKIKADRYSVIKCYTDTGYYMIVERQPDERYLIVEEYLETQPQSDC